MIVPQSQDKVTEMLALKCTATDEEYVDIFRDPSDPFNVDIDSDFTIKIGAYVVTIPHRQKNVFTELFVPDLKAQGINSLLPVKSSKMPSSIIASMSTEMLTPSKSVEIPHITTKPSISYENPKSTGYPAETKNQTKSTTKLAETEDGKPNPTKSIVEVPKEIHDI
ncbi:uncharacterized protein VTP21DRAFT_10213 [Calcarisporiella thermophila]|uniref:uncharacterized protein n=1 Tax=Calcarisporiella thermophila TaxID=911321 RepID=UPI003742F1D4